MTPEQILLTIQAVAAAAEESCIFLQTTAGQRLVEQALVDRVAFDKAVREFGTAIEKFFHGQ